MSIVLRILLIVNSLSCAILCYSSPCRKVQIFSTVPESYVAVQLIVLQVSTIIFGLLWKYYEDKMVRTVRIHAIAEILVYVVAATVAQKGMILGYFIMDMLGQAMFTKNLTFSWFVIIDKRFHDQRKDFDIKSSIGMSIGTIAGAFISLICPPTIWFAWILLPIGISLDNILLLWLTKGHKKTQ